MTREEYDAKRREVVEGMIEMLRMADELELPPLQVQGDFMAAFQAAAEHAAKEPA